MATRNTRSTAQPGAVASDRVRHEWLRRVQAEYSSAAITQELTLWLIRLAAPPALIRGGLRIVTDELRHAELSHGMYRHAAGKTPAALPRETLGLPRTAADLELDVLRATVRVFCLGETAAVRLFTRMREGATLPVARRALDRILRDEVRHRQFGWDLLEWLLSTPAQAMFRAELELALPGWLAHLRQQYGGDGIAMPPTAAEPDTRFPRTDRAWGLISRADYVRAVDRCITGDCRPRFARLGIALATPC